MSRRFIAFDVETPNCTNNRISVIGITLIEDGAVADEFYTLVNPEAHFDSFNIRLTGITPEMVTDQPTFPQLWEEIEPLMGSGVLVAHYAPFDMGVLARCLNDYQINWKPYTYYTCTCVMGRACYPNLENHKLNTLCDYLGIELLHHNAGSDSRACGLLLLDYMERGLKVDRFLRRYNLVQHRTERYYPKTQQSKPAKRLLKLKDL